jgi:hypothetical protein
VKQETVGQLFSRVGQEVSALYLVWTTSLTESAVTVKDAGAPVAKDSLGSSGSFGWGPRGSPNSFRHQLRNSRKARRWPPNVIHELIMHVMFLPVDFHPMIPSYAPPTNEEFGKGPCSVFRDVLPGYYLPCIVLARPSKRGPRNRADPHCR